MEKKMELLHGVTQGLGLGIMQKKMESTHGVI